MSTGYLYLYLYQDINFTCSAIGVKLLYFMEQLHALVIFRWRQSGWLCNGASTAPGQWEHLCHIANFGINFSLLGPYLTRQSGYSSSPTSPTNSSPDASLSSSWIFAPHAHTLPSPLFSPRIILIKLSMFCFFLFFLYLIAFLLACSSGYGRKRHRLWDGRLPQRCKSSQETGWVWE